MTLELGKKQTLPVYKTVDFGIYLGDETDRVLLPAAQVPENTKVGDELEVFLYKDSDDRLIATTREPKLELGKVALLTVKDMTKIGAFLDWGLERDLLLPFREMTGEINAGDSVLAALYVDKSGRLAATMKVYHYLEKGGSFKKEQEVTGRVYEISDNFGAFVAIDDRYSALIPTKQLFGNPPKVGDIIKARVTAIKADGKIDLAIREKAYLQMDSDAERLLDLIKKAGGALEIGDKSDPEQIRAITGMSKNEFKRAAGRLYKEKKVEIGSDGIRLV
ncbi:MAG: S1 RNA-binding domain-containing protein [Lachnospiraceae bacterium]|nr:S1 RNA-binding domain-containing protein [Lachnospiraceae bacterium]